MIKNALIISIEISSARSYWLTLRMCQISEFFVAPRPRSEGGGGGGRNQPTPGPEIDQKARTFYRVKQECTNPPWILLLPSHSKRSEN